MIQQTNSPRSGNRVTVIGGGATGALASVFLAEAGFQVTCLEKTNIGMGSSSRSAACIRAQFGVPETALGMAYSEDFFLNFHEYMQTPSDERCWMIRQNGYLWLYENPSVYEGNEEQVQEAQDRWDEAQSSAEMQQSYGIPSEILSPAEIRSRWPHITSQDLIGGTFCQNDGFLNHDQIYLLGFRRAKELGVKVLQNTEVLGAESRGGRITGLVTDKGLIECDSVVNATNAWAPLVSTRLGGMPLDISPLKRYLWFLNRDKPIQMSDEEWKVLPMTIYGMGNGRGLYSRPFSESELMIGWAHQAEAEHGFSDEDQDTVDPKFTGDHYTDIMMYLNEFSEPLAECGWITRTTAGFYGTTPDESPMIGYDEQVPNLIHAAGFSGHGLMHAPITALLVRELLLNDSSLKQVCLPAPFDAHTMSTGVFAPGRTIDASKREKAVI